MQIVKGARGKNLEMARLFVEQKGDLFLDYGKSATMHGIFTSAGVRDKVYHLGRDTSLVFVMSHLDTMIRTHSDLSIFIDGNFDESEINLLKIWADNLPTLTLIVSQQTQDEALEVLTV